MPYPVPVPAHAVQISNEEIRRRLTAGGDAAWARGAAAPPPGIAAVTSAELWAVIERLAPNTDATAAGLAGASEMTVLVRSAIYQRREGADRRVSRQFWAVIAALTPEIPGGRRFLVCHTYANSVDQQRGTAISVGTHHQISDVIDCFNALLAAKRAAGYRARRRSGPGRVSFSDLAASAAALRRR